ncbi:MAG: hypothetical protein DRJ41_02610 [Thermoprotei archaeon]|nr:MAG: hypothetical protein DRJ41_02610 [Thermoprotei archaeon]
MERSGITYFTLISVLFMGAIFSTWIINPVNSKSGDSSITLCPAPTIIDGRLYIAVMNEGTKSFNGAIEVVVVQNSTELRGRVALVKPLEPRQSMILEIPLNGPKALKRGKAEGMLLIKNGANVESSNHRFIIDVFSP